MAGFALFMTVLFFSTVGVVLTSVASLSLYVLTRRYAPEASAEGKRSRYELVAAPLLALLWIYVALLFHVEMSNRLAHQDCGFSPDPYVTLPNRYVLGSHNTYDGYFKAPGFETDMPISGPGYVRSIVDLHMHDGLFTGSQFDFRTSHVREFSFNTQTHEFQSVDKDKSPACDSQETRCMDKWTQANDRAQAGPYSYWLIYREYRHQWPNYVLCLLLLSGESAIAIWAYKLWRRVQLLSSAQSHGA